MGFVASADGKSAFFIRNLDIYYADISQLEEAIKPMIDPVLEVVHQSHNTKNNSTQLPKVDKTDLVIYFDFDKSLISRENLDIIKQVKSEYLNIKVNGYCDSDGSINYNRELASRRCNAVIDELVKLGIPLSTITKNVFGELLPVADNSNENGKALNRRVEIKLN